MKREHYYKEAKRQEYRSRAVFKLQQLNKRFSVIKRDQVVVDLGCSPGGWCQVLREIVGDKGLVIGLDIARTRPLDGVTLIRGDIRDEGTRRAVIEALGGRAVGVVVSDMSPNLSGTYSIDQARSVELADMALKFARGHLKKGGGFIVKVFQGESFKSYLVGVGRYFSSCRAFSPDASRARSSEIYIVAKGYLGRGETGQGTGKVDEEEQEEDVEVDGYGDGEANGDEKEDDRPEGRDGTRPPGG